MTTPIRTRIRSFVLSASAPDARELPRLRVVLAFPALLLVLGVILVALGINGTSSGEYHSVLSTSADPQLIAGHPQAIRSDEWNTQTSWMIGQIQQGFPVVNQTFPGGMDAAVPFDLPRLEWSVAFRPHDIGYLLLDPGRGTAWRWWIGALATLAACYVFLVILIPRRPFFAAAVSVAFYFSPFFQWWFQTAAFWPTVWAMVVLSAMVWLSRSATRSAMVVWGILIAYFTAVMAMGIYAPFIIAVAYVVAVLGIARVISLRRDSGSWRPVLRIILPIAAGGAVAAAVTAAFLAENSAAVTGLLSTVYPGNRLVPTGSAHPRSLLTTFASSFAQALKSGGFLGDNSSEASTFFLFGIFLIPIAIWIIIRGRRLKRPLPWELVLLIALIVVFVAFLVVPGWDAIAHVLLLDRIAPQRLRIGFGVASIALFGYLVKAIDDERLRVPRLLLWGTVALFLLVQVAGAVLEYRSEGAAALAGAGYWWFFAAVSAVALYAIARRWTLVASIALLLAIVPTTITVNPVYSGVFDLRTTAPGRALHAWNAHDTGTWVGIGSPIVTALLVESGVTAYNGVQGAPSKKMWTQIDPSHAYASHWNRIGFVNWTPGHGEPRVTSPGNDQIVVTLDACSAFAQKNVDFVLSDAKVDDPCLSLQKSVSVQTGRFLIYDVVAPR